MVEFQEVMRERERMCRTNYEKDGNCEGCALERLREKTMLQCWRYFCEHYEESAKAVMAWAAENPAPVYPTFAEWLNSIGVTISDRPFPAPNIPVYVFQVNAKMFEPIPPDIAQKLGLQPKEGT